MKKPTANTRVHSFSNKDSQDFIYLLVVIIFLLLAINVFHDSFKDKYFAYAVIDWEFGAVMVIAAMVIGFVKMKRTTNRSKIVFITLTCITLVMAIQPVVFLANCDKIYTGNRLYKYVDTDIVSDNITHYDKNRGLYVIVETESGLPCPVLLNETSDESFELFKEQKINNSFVDTYRYDMKLTLKINSNLQTNLFIKLCLINPMSYHLKEMEVTKEFYKYYVYLKGQ